MSEEIREVLEMDSNWDSVTKLAGELMACQSVSPADDGAQSILAERLERAGFKIDSLCIDGVHSFLAIYGKKGPLVAFSGHSDVVPAGDPAAWSSPPFEPEVREGCLYGRGAIDMKGPLSASVVAAESFASRCSEKGLPIRVGFLVAGDEEVMSNHGTKDLLALLAERGDRVEHCIVTESTSHSVLGDMVKVGRRGSLVGQLTIRGVQGHSAYPHLASNPISKALLPLRQLDEKVWGRGYEGFPPTSFQITNIQAGTGAANVIPGDLQVMFNFRFSPEYTSEVLQDEVEKILKEFNLDFDIVWSCDARPFLTQKGVLSEIVSESIQSILGLDTEFSTTGGTSDARFIAPTGAEVIEFGTLSKMCHQVDEHVAVSDLNQLSKIYEDVLDRFVTHYQGG
ncbi:succinyl-diaminopimelate desuccinylase [Verrucomicrobia bacterium]|jgi:succinyl-diaminopimelate desuccinylase|nr:succinyl-diaminopimelate desuccinylase [Verrucomicrobiota bacterium]